MDRYFVEYKNEKCHKVSKFFPTIEEALKFFLKAEKDGYFVALYNCR